MRRRSLKFVTLKQAINHWIDKGLLPPENNFTLEIDKVTESTTYCFTAEEVAAMVQHCRESGRLNWLADVIIGLAYTGMRIGELAQLRWTAVHRRKSPWWTIAAAVMGTGPMDEPRRAVKAG